MQGA
jgi:hypothetical protein